MEREQEWIIEYFEFRVEPWRYSAHDARRFRVLMRVNNEQLDYNVVVPVDDIVSRFDWMFDEAKKAMKEYALRLRNESRI